MGEAGEAGGAAAVTVEWLLEVVPAEVWPGVGVAPAVDWTVMAVTLVALVDVSSVMTCPWFGDK